MKDNLINASDIAIANYIIDKGKKFSIDIDNFELNAIFAMLEGWSLTKYKKHLCRYKSNLYFEVGEMWQYKNPSILAINVASAFSDYNCNKIDMYYVQYRKQNGELKKYVQHVTKKERAEEYFIDFDNQVTHLLFYYNLANNIFIPEIQELGATRSTQELDVNIEQIIKDSYDKYYSDIVKQSKKTEFSYAQAVSAGFSATLFNKMMSTKAGRAILASAEKVSKDSDKYAKVLNIVEQTYNYSQQNAD